MRSRDNGLAPVAMITLGVTSLYCSIAIIAMAFKGQWKGSLCEEQG